ncbi:uncharacterized protein TRIVIDRAFT_220174 [Trichoderma virens Gv29-8]|uniref:BZIP domain-containing protein n=1 Tax=Hypocrea virens (strain Gv29-8 / FGSC 10586) TaxID=413071 RepID=G9MKI5_HYPVG|nr:uncharacterized protein TRIVIDRAFT_220174 [Trichoderma virens Gv29-8]EHK24733.1 hypothetical protein TRIVIDRAFT_220174 [Trichoderma virens Gv29-8]UKZ54998.1 hypothetical protein TrVGV298_008814 [Trichoderma virens]
MADRIFRIFNPREPKGDPIEKRRAQLRRAQQSYRDRKDKYTKALEAELARSRKSEAGLTSELERLRGKLQILTNLLSQNGISLPLEFSNEDIYHGDTSHSAASQLTTRGQPRKADGRPSNTQSAFTGTMTTNQGSILNSENRNLRQYGSSYFTRDNEPQVPRPRTATATTLAAPRESTRLSELDATMVGMEFVLTLERPCLNHIHGNPKKPLEPHGHALTTTVQLQASLSLPPIDPKNPVPPSYHNAPAAVLDRLLNLAPSVSADGDVTPIQAWHYIRRQPHFGGFDMQSLNKLAERLREAAKCHGFGAAVQTGVFESAVREILHPVAVLVG